jgi:hypothetical protein
MKMEAPEALALLFAWEGVPPMAIVNCAKEMKLREFAQKCKEASCCLWDSKPYSP